MRNPWEEISLEDYENHMRLDSVRQLQALSKIMKGQLDAYPVSRVMILGVAGGNGLDRNMGCRTEKSSCGWILSGLEKSSRTTVRELFRFSLDRSGNLAGAHAPGADIHVAGGTVHDRLDTFHVGLPGTVGTPVRVRDLNAKGHAFAAILTLSHPLHLPADT